MADKLGHSVLTEVKGDKGSLINTCEKGKNMITNVTAASAADSGVPYRPGTS